ncbi:von Willebrand factor type A [Thauera phenylacetica B4P]|uniref:von Willebrand factor type A n=1 Tax=Thauera phenylacetica B4P TaxID=1234382 RepID=N6ZR82_9RHOO|nr:VWA domain-containing protein [Thauera phenylacetica]ENO96833.1 von Willebrand factor type A [Thauera phenylacetica B4P]
MEETVGLLWHRLITRAAGGHFPKAAVRLRDIEKTAGVFFRALGGDPGLRLAAATTDEHGARRSLLQRIAGADERVARARMDVSTLRLPPELDVLPERSLNRDLYLWLAAVAAAPPAEDGDGHPMLGPVPDEPIDEAATRELRENQAATLRALARWPGIEARYRRLVDAVIAQRPRLEKLPPPEAEREKLIRLALHAPGSVAALPRLPAKARVTQPVLLWLSDFRASATVGSTGQGSGELGEAGASRPGKDSSRQAHRVERQEQMPEKHGMIIPFRAESLLSVAEFIKVQRSTDDEPDDNAADAAANLDHLSITRDGERVASKVRFDLDLPSAAEDDVVLGDGIPLPEWDYRKNLLLEDHVRLTELTPSIHDPRAAPSPLPEHLRRTARRLHRQFAALTPGRRWLKAQVDGTELDLDAVVRAATDRATGHHPSDQLYLSLEKRERDLACLALADLSLSTDSWVSSEARVIDVIRDSLLLFGEALLATGDSFALCGFSSVKRSNVRFHRLKDFDQRFDDRARGRIMAIKPGYYTRLGAAIRHATTILDGQRAARRILLILSDGKPNDLDLYDGRYGIEDTRVAVVEARNRGVVPFCVTIDREGASYLPHLFGPAGYAVIRQPDELPARLPMFYAQLTR